ncbi:MAG: DUF3102 domain-containing protein [Spirochaetes bacterium]|nr:DUF3102 domain-containing protein [Spirochaetota bacterium]
MDNDNNNITLYENKDFEKSVIEEMTSLHNDIKSMMEKTFQKALRLGELLVFTKKELPHGSFISWINQNLPFKQRTAQQYMLVFEKKAELEKMSITNLSSAYRWLTGKNASDAHLKTATVTDLDDDNDEPIELDDVQLTEVDESKELEQVYKKLEKLENKVTELEESNYKKDNQIELLKRKVERERIQDEARDTLFDTLRKVKDAVIKPDCLEGDFTECAMVNTIITKTVKHFREHALKLETIAVNELSRKALYDTVSHFLSSINNWSKTVAKRFKINPEDIK